MLGLLRFFGLRALERRLFGNGQAAGGRGGFARAGLPLGGWPMLAYLAWSNRSRLASAFRWVRSQFGSRGSHSLHAGVRA